MVHPALGATEWNSGVHGIEEMTHHDKEEAI